MPSSPPSCDEPCFHDVCVEPHAALPDGLMLRFKAAPGAESRPVERVPYLADDADDAVWCRVEGRDDNDAPCPAWVLAVEDSSAGVSLLVYGGSHGLHLVPEGAPVGMGSAAVAETHLLLPRGALS